MAALRRARSGGQAIADGADIGLDAPGNRQQVAVLGDKLYCSRLSTAAQNAPTATRVIPRERVRSWRESRPWANHTPLTRLHELGGLNTPLSRLVRHPVSIRPKGRPGLPLRRVRRARRGALPNARLCVEPQAQQLLAQSQ